MAAAVSLFPMSSRYAQINCFKLMLHMMKKAMAVLLLAACIPVFANFSVSPGSSSIYDIVGIYEMVELKEGAKVLDAYDNVQDAEVVFIPIRMDTGTYEVELTRIDDNFYHICGTSQYIETRYCYKYAVREDAILNIKTNYGYTRGEVNFLD